MLAEGYFCGLSNLPYSALLGGSLLDLALVFYSDHVLEESLLPRPIMQRSGLERKGFLFLEYLNPIKSHLLPRLIAAKVALLRSRIPHSSLYATE